MIDHFIFYLGKIWALQYDNGEEVALLYTEKDTVRYVVCSYTHRKTHKYTQSGRLYIDTATEKDTARYVVRSYT